MAEYKNQHTVPESYLRGFSRDKHANKLYQLDKKTGKKCFVDPKNASIWKFAYSFKQDTGEWNHQAEKNLSQIETEAIPVIRKLQHASHLEELSPQDRFYLALFVMSSWRRPRRMMEEFTAAAQSNMQDPRWNERILRSIEEDFGRKLPDEEREQYIRVLEKGRTKQSLDRIKSRQLRAWFDSLPIHALKFNSMYWKMLVVVRPHFFVTSDSPAFTRLVGEPDTKANQFVRFADPNVEFVMALSQKHMLLARHNSWSEKTNPSKSRVRELNCRTIRMANRFVWAPTNSCEVETHFENFKDFIPPLPKFQSVLASI